MHEEGPGVSRASIRFVQPLLESENEVRDVEETTGRGDGVKG
jgi:hypothetical protein